MKIDILVNGTYPDYNRKYSMGQWVEDICNVLENTTCNATTVYKKLKQPLNQTPLAEIFNIAELSSIVYLYLHLI